MNDKTMTMHMARSLYKSIRRRYRANSNKQRIRMQYCKQFSMAERSFYRKIKENSFNAHELKFLFELLQSKKGGKR